MKFRNKIAIIGEIHSDGIKFLQSKNCDILDLTNSSIKELQTKLVDIDGIALRTAQLKKDILQYCSSLKIVARHGVGYDNVDLNYLNKNKLALAITGTSNAVSVAEHVMTMFLYLSKQINISDQLVKEGKFKEKKLLPNFFELYKKNILILGFGRIGQAVAKRCLGFDSNVYVYDPFINQKFIEEKNCKFINFDEGIQKADFITVHMPINKKTKNLITKDQFKKMKTNCIIVNTARGGIINEKDLFTALSDKKIYGAGLDVYEYEPPSTNNPLFKLDNILLTPHNAALTLECRKRMALEVCENIIYYLQDQTKLNINNIINRDKINL